VLEVRVLERRQRLDGRGQASAGDESVFTDLGIVAGMRVCPWTVTSKL
jgi:hypothetical protein